MYIIKAQQNSLARRNSIAAFRFFFSSPETTQPCFCNHSRYTTVPLSMSVGLI